MPGVRLSLHEREEIRVGLANGESIRRIARGLGRAGSTVAREVTHNGGRHEYRAVRAEERARRLACRPKPFKLVSDPVLAEAVTELMTRTQYSPATVAGMLAAQGLKVSHETIYRACYQPGRGLEPDLWKLLPRRRQKRRHAGHQWGIASGNPLGNPVSVHARPPIALTRIQPGHLEGDLIIGSRNQSAVITLIDRLTRYTWLAALPNGYKTEFFTDALIQLLQRISPRLRLTLTWDQGREMRYWTRIQQQTNTRIYICDRHAPWQRPTVENNNGILRRWLPKGADLSTYTQNDLDKIAALINDMPRRIHKNQSAATIYHAHLVATTG